MAIAAPALVFCLLAACIGRAVAQSGDVYRRLGREVEACTGLQANMLRDAEYVKRIERRFTGNTCGDIQSTFVIGTEKNTSASNALFLICSKTTFPDFEKALQGVGSVTGLSSIELERLKERLLSFIPARGFTRTHAQCASCFLGEWLHEFYLNNPGKAPAAHRQFYSSINEPGKDDPKGNTTTTAGGQMARIGQATLPRSYLLYGALGLSLLLAASVFITAKITSKRAKASMNMDDLLNNPALQTHLQQQHQQLQQQLIQAVQGELQRQQNQLNSLNTEVRDLRGKNEQLERELAAGGGGGQVDTQKLNQILTDFARRIGELEKKPQASPEPAQIHLSPQELIDWIQSRPDIKAAMKEALDIVTLHDLVVRLIPSPLSLKALDDLERETLARQWRLFAQRDEFLPSALDEFRRRLMDEIKRNNNRIY